MPSADIVLQYHERTKHTLERYAKGPETLDWDDQPDPFRRFLGCETIALAKPGAELAGQFAELHAPGAIPSQPVNLLNVGLLLELAFGLSAWKEFGPSRWSLRCNPSSGNLHPTEAYLLSTDARLIEPGVYHYVSHDHSLERRAKFQDLNTAGGLYIGLSSVHWREAWKYGERAFRYCQHDIGHALGALSYAAACLGWSIELLPAVGDADLARLLGLDRNDDFKKDEDESADVLCRIVSEQNHSCPDLTGLLAAPGNAGWFGKAASLRAYHLYKWPVIDQVSQAAIKPVTEEPVWQPALTPLAASQCTKPVSQIIRQRRSAQQFDGKMAALALTDFYRILSATLPGQQLPFDSWPWSPKVHLFVFVHRVDSLEPGLYALLRDEQCLPALQANTLASFDWQKMAGALPFYHLHSGDLKQIAKTLSCHQPIASDSAFSLAMVAEFQEAVSDSPWQYRRLFWECGLIGQVLYLEAEAAGVRGTGIGCYFDDSVHEILGIKSNTYQSLYHFTVGKPLEDARLQTFPAYAHLQMEA